MKVKLVAGAELDTVSKAELDEAMERQTRAIIKALAHRPMIRDVPAQGTTDANGVCDIAFGVPTVGQMWDLRRISVTGVDPTVLTTFATGRLYVGEPGDPRAFVDTFTSASGGAIPNVGSWGTDQVIVQQGDRLTLRLTGVTVGAILLGVAVFRQGDRPSEEPSVKPPPKR